MRVGAEVRTLYLVLVTIQVLTSLAGIALLGRMSPAIAGVLEANEQSVEAAERMLEVLVRGDVESTAFLGALAMAEANVTEADERPVLALVRARSAAALGGDPAARDEVASALLRLSQINREAMRRADDDVQRLGLAGRWALAVLGLLGVLGSALALREARHRMITPLLELVSVLRARRSGDRHRRYVLERENELSRALAQVNDLLDAAERGSAPSGTSRSDLRETLSALLDRLGGSRALVDANDELVALSASALELLALEGERVREGLREGESPWVIERAPLGRLTLVTLRG